MIKRISTLIVSSLLLLSVVAVPVAAHEGEAEAETETEHVTTTTTETEMTQEQRIEKRKTEFKEKLLSGAAELRLKNRCKAAQGLVKGPQARAKAIKTSRDKIYGDMETRLDGLVVKLKAKNVDTATLESQIDQLKSLIDQFKTDLATYTTAVDDLVAMDCEADPDAFKAALEEARSKRNDLKDEASAIRTYVKETIKPTLKAIRDQLEADETGSNTETKPETETNTQGEQ